MGLFDKTDKTFRGKSNWQLRKEIWILRLIFNRLILNLNVRIINRILSTRIPIKWIVWPVIYKKFCSGETIQSSIKVVQENWKLGVYSYIGYAVEANGDPNQFDTNFKQIINEIKYSKAFEPLRFAVFKPTSLGQCDLFEIIQKKDNLSNVQKGHWEKIINRFDQLALESAKYRINLLIDAEESWIQNAIDDLSIAQIKRYNNNQAIIYTTVQMYRKDGMEKLKKLKGLALTEKVVVGVKLVRGAYLEKENKRALSKGYESPICNSKKDTDKNFLEGVEYILKHLDYFSLFLGTHSESSILYCIDLMSKMRLKKNHERIWFSQLYGMGDHITYNMALNGYNTVKYIPYGPLRDIIPYLLRRAQENSSVIGHASREIELIKQELRNRKSKIIR